MFITGLFTIATCRQPKYPSAGELMKNMWCVYTHTYSGILAIRKNEIMPFAATWIDLEIIALSKVSQRQIYDIAYIWNLTEKAMAPHSSTLAWKIPWMEEPGRLQSMGPLRVRHDWTTSLSLFTFMPWRRKWQPTPVFLPGESQGRGSLMGCRLWGPTESDTTEVI